MDKTCERGTRKAACIFWSIEYLKKIIQSSQFDGTHRMSAPIKVFTKSKNCIAML
jgi:hypothetical protein